MAPDASADDVGPEGPTQLSKRSWYAALRRTAREFRDDNLTDWAAALTYYSVLSLFPALLVFVALVGVFGEYPETTDAVLRIVGDIAPDSTVDTLRDPIERVVREKGGAGALLGVGLLASLWSASGYVGAFMRASNIVYEVEEGRRIWKKRPLQIAITIVMVLLAALVAMAIVVTGPVARAIGNEIGLGDTAVLIWDIAKWPVLLLVVLTMFAVLYYTAPNVRLPKFRWVTPGAIVAIVVWVAASIAFGFFVANFGSYNNTYGSLGGVIVFLVWMWVTNAALLLGAELNAELERGRELQAGQEDAEHDLQLPPRDAPKPRRAENAGSP